MSDAKKEQLSRWLPTFVALAGIIAQGFFIGQRLGAAEEKLKNTTNIAVGSVSRVEYLAEKAALATQLADVKQTQRDMNLKLDRLLERNLSQ